MSGRKQEGRREEGRRGEGTEGAEEWESNEGKVRETENGDDAKEGGRKKEKGGRKTAQMIRSGRGGRIRQ
jgi:hypothetical protein